VAPAGTAPIEAVQTEPLEPAPDDGDFAAFDEHNAE
jgi:hypothetical protein